MLLFYEMHLEKVTGEALSEWGGRKACLGRVLITKTKPQHWKYLRGAKEGAKKLGELETRGHSPPTSSSGPF